MDTLGPTPGARLRVLGAVDGAFFPHVIIKALSLVPGALANYRFDEISAPMRRPNLHGDDESLRTRRIFGVPFAKATAVRKMAAAEGDNHCHSRVRLVCMNQEPPQGHCR
ncbi:MAG: hypothetical protein NVSMB14_04310 [Isosphaeraceae bacterium]